VTSANVVLLVATEGAQTFRIFAKFGVSSFKSNEIGRHEIAAFISHSPFPHPRRCGLS